MTKILYFCRISELKIGKQFPTSWFKNVCNKWQGIKEEEIGQWTSRTESLVSQWGPTSQKKKKKKKKDEASL